MQIIDKKCCQCLRQFKQKHSGEPLLTTADDSNPWWRLLENAVKEAGGKTSKPEIFPASTDARYFRMAGVPAFGFSPISNTPSLLHDHNEVCDDLLSFIIISFLTHVVLFCCSIWAELSI